MSDIQWNEIEQLITSGATAWIQKLTKHQIERVYGKHKIQFEDTSSLDQLRALVRKFVKDKHKTKDNAQSKDNGKDSKNTKIEETNTVKMATYLGDIEQFKKGQNGPHFQVSWKPSYY